MLQVALSLHQRQPASMQSLQVNSPHQDRSDRLIEHERVRCFSIIMMDLCQHERSTSSEMVTTSVNTSSPKLWCETNGGRLSLELKTKSPAIFFSNGSILSHNGKPICKEGISLTLLQRSRISSQCSEVLLVGAFLSVFDAALL